MKKIAWLIVVISFISLIPTFTSIVKAGPSTWYVATTGSDAAAGDYAHPFKTIQKAVDVALAGDTVYIRGGTYYQKVVMKRSGTSGNPIVLAGYPGETVVIDGNGISLGHGYGLIHLFTYKYLTFRNLEIKNSNMYGIGTNFNQGTNPTSDITIEYCSFSNIRYNAINIRQEDNSAYILNAIVSNCSFDGIQTGRDAGECITFYNCLNSRCEYNTLKNIGKIGIGVCQSSNFVIHKNDIDNTGMDTGAFAIYIDASESSGSGHSCEYITISDNYVHGDRQGIGFSGEVGSGNSINHVTLVNNVVSTSSYDAIACFKNSGSNAVTMTDFKIIHNTIYKPSGICISISSTLTISSFVIANNILYGSRTYSGPTSLTITNNLFYPGTSYGTNTVKLNPQFISTTNFHLMSTSPAIDAGSSEYITSFDYNGNIRLQGSGCDIGAYEYYYTEVIPHALSLSPVFGNPSPVNGSANNLPNLTWSIPINDLEGNSFSWTIECSNGETSSGTNASNGIKSLQLSVTNLTTYTVWVNATDPSGSGQYTSEWFTFSTYVSIPPETPIIYGPVTGRRRVSYDYNFVAMNPGGNDVYYRIDWGDGSPISNWIGPYHSLGVMIINHTYSNTGNFIIKCQAKGASNSISDWGQLQVSIKRSPYQYYNYPILRYSSGY